MRRYHFSSITRHHNRSGLMTLEEFAEALVVDVDDIVASHQDGLLPRPANGAYGQAHLTRMTMIIKAEDLGFSRDETLQIIKHFNRKRGVGA